MKHFVGSVLLSKYVKKNKKSYPESPHRPMKKMTVMTRVIVFVRNGEIFVSTICFDQEANEKSFEDPHIELLRLRSGVCFKDKTHNALNPTRFVNQETITVIDAVRAKSRTTGRGVNVPIMNAQKFVNVVRHTHGPASRRTVAT